MMQKDSDHRPLARRDFLRACLRYPALAGLAALGALLLTRSQGIFGRGACLPDQVCGRCALLPDCEQPRARSARKGS